MRNRLGGRAGPILAGFWLLLLIAVFGGEAAGQTVPPVPDQAPPPSSSPAAEPDTAIALLRGAADWPEPEAIYVWPDSVLFGNVAVIVLDFPDPTALDPQMLTCSVDWLEWVDPAGSVPQKGIAGWWGRFRERFLKSVGGPKPALDNLPRHDGSRIQRAVRILWPGPYQIRWSGNEEIRSPVQAVATRLQKDLLPAPIRSPRSLGWSWTTLLVLAAALIALAWLIWRLKRHRWRKVAEAVPRSIPSPAYLTTAQELWELHESGIAGSREGKLFLDRLSVILRGYLRGRFGVHAAEMTPHEISQALIERGFRIEQAERFAQILRECDVQRYRPGQVSAENCGRLLRKGIELVGTARIEALYTPVPAQLAIRGQRCWQQLQALVGRSWSVSETSASARSRS